MSGQTDVSPINTWIGMPVLSLATGNKLGFVTQVLIDPLSGVLAGVALDRDSLAYDQIYSFGRDAIMAVSDLAVQPLEESGLADGRNAKRLIGAQVVTESGEVLGTISNVLITLKPPPFAVYAVRRSLLDKILGREFYLSASESHALSDDSERLIVQDSVADLALADLETAVARAMTVRTFTPPQRPAAEDDEGDETVVRFADEDETVLRFRDEDETIVRQPKTGT
ncbi:MAG TPA: PRC-barrel domain-containing protein [Pyrinomonadaceae bacterium]|nr:PRC-barrel domain-containing protein [Pyrinomonadaceae bacterium]